MLSGMLNERRARAVTYDAPTDVLRMIVSDAPPSPTGRATKRTVMAALLLDANRFLVGVDVGEGAEARVVVMIGPHEAVTSTPEARVEIALTDGEVREVNVPNARAACRANETNPYA
jgi:hypothetical protein